MDRFRQAMRNEQGNVHSTDERAERPSVRRMDSYPQSDGQSSDGYQRRRRFIARQSIIDATTQRSLSQSTRRSLPTSQPQPFSMPMATGSSTVPWRLRYSSGLASALTAPSSNVSLLRDSHSSPASHHSYTAAHDIVRIASSQLHLIKH